MRKTELTPRKQAILAAIVKAYIETGEPIGSKNLTLLLENAPSSATLRNEMNELCALGFLNQPHTSAGRIPTSSGYRFYINQVMQPRDVDNAARSFLERQLLSRAIEPNAVPALMCEALSRITGLPSISVYMVDAEITLKSVKLLPVSRRTAALLMITSDGRTYSRICRLGVDMSEQLSTSFIRLTDEKLRRKPLNMLDKAYLQTVTASAGAEMFMLLPLLTELFDMAEGAARSSVSAAGQDRLYGIFGEAAARRIAMLINEDMPIITATDTPQEKTQIIFGSDTGFSELSDTVFITAPYSVDESYSGRIGIIGSRRMDYEQVIPSVEYAADRLGEYMTAAVKDMED